MNEEKLDLIIQLRKELHDNPEISMHEVKTKQILMRFIHEHTRTLEITDRGQWFYVMKKGIGRSAPIAFRADFDAVTCADGCPRHLCGHDGHSASLACFALWLDTAETDKDVYLVFQPGEENGMGGAICSSLIDEKNICEIYGFHNIPGYGIGDVLLLKHTFACASTGLEIHFIGRQSHAAYPENGANPANAIAATIQCMNESICEKHKGIVLGTVIGIEAGSHSYGVSAGDGTLRLTLRAECQDEYDAFVSEIENAAIKAASDSGLTIKMSRIEEFPATINNERCVDKLRDAAAKLNANVVNPSEPFRWSEDFGYYLRKTDGAFMGIGCGINHPALHTTDYEFDDRVIPYAVEMYKTVLSM